jgi:hypothetical protein
MKLPAVKLAVLAVFSLASSSTVILSHSPCEPEPVQPSTSPAEAQVPEVVLLRITAKCRVAREVIAGRLSPLERLPGSSGR